MSNRAGDPIIIGEGHFRDTGCELAPSCLSCWLPRCRYDLAPGELRSLTNRHRRGGSRGVQR